MLLNAMLKSKLNELAPDVAELESCGSSTLKQPFFNEDKPVIVLVHGLRGSPQSFNRLAQQLQSSGQQPLCFTYNDRDSLVSSSAKLADSLRQLVSQIPRKEIVILGHSLGALVARRALISEHWGSFPDNPVQLRLVTVSGPFGGISTASGCTSPVMKLLTFGLVIPLCKMVSGDKWSEITFRSDFIRHPGYLNQYVSMHLKIETDEEQGCLIFDERICRISDFVFTLDEQRNPAIDRDKKVRIVVVRAGHVGILGSENFPPSQLISVLEKNRLLPAAGSQFANTVDSFVQRHSDSSGSSGQAGH